MARRWGSGDVVLSVVIQLRLGAVLQFGTHVFSKCLFFFLSKNINIRMCRTIILPLVLYGCKTWSHIERGTQAEACRE